MMVGGAYVFPGFLTQALTQLFFPKPPTTFLTCFWRGERRKNAGKKIPLNLGSNSQPPGHESDTLTTEPPGWGCSTKDQCRAPLLSVADVRTGGRWFDPRHNQYPFRGLMVVIATGFIPLSPLSVV